MDKNNEEIKKILSQSVVKSLHDFLSDGDCGDDYKDMYTGVIVDNDDPDRVGKCKIRVFGIHGDEIQDSDLPWAFPDFDFRGGLKGSFIVPPIDCVVNVYFERGELYIPRYSHKVIDENNLPSNKDDDYPDNMVFFETDNGDKFEINRKKKTAMFEHASGTKITHTMKETEFEHHSGAKITIDATGNITIDSPMTIKTKHGLFLEDSGSAVIPSGKGPYCAFPACVITGGTHSGYQCAP